MLHNSGPFGPNDAPVNMGAPINMSQMSGPMDIAQNLSNLGKIPQQPPQSSSTHYNMPDYSAFGHPQMNMNTQMNPFQNYPLSYQPSYIPQNFHSNTGLNNVQNGMLPINLNVSSQSGANAMNYHTSFGSKRQIDSIINNEYKEQDLSNKNAPINIPQVHTKAFHKHIGLNNESINNYQHFNLNQDRYSNQNPNLNTKLHEKILSQDETRRKSLENTVKFIENMLLQTTQQKNKINETVNQEAKGDASKGSVSSSENTVNDDDEESDDEKTIKDDQQEMKESNIKDNESKSELENESDTESENDIKPIVITGKEFEEISGTTDNISVKVEPVASWTDIDNLNPFHKDTNGLSRDNVDSSDIVDSENSVSKATEIVETGTDSNSYFECPHCTLLFKGPKRFLIHAKWHSFGLTNDKRMELAREREMRRNQRKEARILERLNANEVKDIQSGEKTYPCKDCDKIFNGKSSLKNHRQRYHPTRVRECKVCSKTVLGWMALRNHMTTHTSDAGYQCNECPKRFKFPHSLAKHRDTHLEKTHECTQCEKKFGSEALLKMHMKTHERVLRGATFRCTYCGKGFFESYNLQVHERTHRNERPFHCEICNSNFGTNSSLKRHIKVSHSTSKPYECSTCHRCFVSEVIKDRHELRAHGDPEEFKFTCKKCPCRYMKQKDLRKHMYKVHPKGKRKRKEKSDTE